MKLFKLVFVCLLLVLPLFGQNQPLPTSTFSFAAAPIGLVSANGSFIGTDAGLQFSPTPNFSLQSANILSSDARSANFLALAGYNIAPLSRKLNNLMPKVSGFRINIGVRGGAGVSRQSDAAGNVKQSVGILAQGTFSYSLDSGGTWQFGGNFGAGKFGGQWQKVFEAGPSLHF